MKLKPIRIFCFTIRRTAKPGMAQIFGVEVPAISKHLKNIFDSRELDEKAVVSKMEITADTRISPHNPNL